MPDEQSTTGSRYLDDLRTDLIALRRDLHAFPEVGLRVPNTQARILTELAPMNVEVTTGGALDSVTAVLRGARTGPTVLLRAEMDALLVTETANLPYRSRTAGVMHACGHDLNATMLVGAAKLLHAHRTELAGDVVFMFQPGEEGHRGAAIMLDEGVLDASGTRAQAAYALHVLSAEVPHGIFTARAGTACASADRLIIQVRGRGGHASAPHLARDPVQAASAIVLALSSAVGRRTDPFDGSVLSIGSIHGGEAPNVIPEVVELTGTLRCVSEISRAALLGAIREVCTGVATTYGVHADLRAEAVYPLTVNAHGAVEHARQVVSDELSPRRWQPMNHPTSGSEDFSYVLSEVPGAIIFLGAVPPRHDPTTAAYNHSAAAVFDEAVLLDGAKVLAMLAQTTLAQRP